MLVRRQSLEQAHGPPPVLWATLHKQLPSAPYYLTEPCYRCLPPATLPSPPPSSRAPTSQKKVPSRIISTLSEVRQLNSKLMYWAQQQARGGEGRQHCWVQQQGDTAVSTEDHMYSSLARGWGYPPVAVLLVR